MKIFLIEIMPTVKFLYTDKNLDIDILLRRGHDELAEWMFDQEL